MSHLSLVDAQQSEVESYLQKVIRSGIENSVSSTNAKNEQMNNVENGNVETRSPRKEVASIALISSSLYDDSLCQSILQTIGCYMSLISSLAVIIHCAEETHQTNMSMFAYFIAAFFIDTLQVTSGL